MANLPACMSCDLVKRRDEGRTPPWDSIFRTRHWDAVHIDDTAIPGWLVLVSRRHIAAIADMDEDEAIELGRLQRVASQAIQTVTGCAKTYVAQFAESPQHPHVHFHIIPRMAGLAADHRGPAVFALMGVPEDQRVSEEDRNSLAKRLRPLFEAALA